MKCGIKALLITLAIATTGMSASALAASPQPKRSLYRAKLTPLHRHLPKLKPLNGKSTEDDGTRVSINTASAEDLARVMNGVGLKSTGYRQLP